MFQEKYKRALEDDFKNDDDALRKRARGTGHLRTTSTTVANVAKNTSRRPLPSIKKIKLIWSHENRHWKCVTVPPRPPTDSASDRARTLRRHHGPS